MTKVETFFVKRSRQIVERIVVKGNLITETPTRFGNGDTDGLVDMPLALDPLDGKALLTGASIAGALRSYLRERQLGYGVDDKARADSVAKQLFGYQESDLGEQSLLIISDALGERPVSELRDGVQIDAQTRTAADKKKYDLEVMQAGVTFPLCFELLIQKDADRAKLLSALATTLHGLESGEIALGARKRRGYGQCRVNDWQVRHYDLTQPQDLVDYLENDFTGATTGAIDNALKAAIIKDQRAQFSIKATFVLDGSLLIRVGSVDPGVPDMAHLESWRNGERVPVLPGTSVAGALRARVGRIAKTLKLDPDEITHRIFGGEIEGIKKQKLRASRVWIKESVVERPLKIVQNRVKLDRFTGGAYPTALFSEKPVFARGDTEITITLRLQNPDPSEMGILLLALKDLWTGDLALGGEASVGRGRLRGKHAQMEHRTDATEHRWILTAQDSGLAVEGDKAILESYVQALHTKAGAR